MYRNFFISIILQPFYSTLFFPISLPSSLLFYLSSPLHLFSHISLLFYFSSLPLLSLHFPIFLLPLLSLFFSISLLPLLFLFYLFYYSSSSPICGLPYLFFLLSFFFLSSLSISISISLSLSIYLSVYLSEYLYL